MGESAGPMIFKVGDRVRQISGRTGEVIGTGAGRTDSRIEVRWDEPWLGITESGDWARNFELLKDEKTTQLDDHETAYPELPVDQPSIFEPVEVRSSEVIAAIEFAWGEIQKRNPELPSVFVTIGSGTKPGKGTNVTLGHFAALRWQVGESKIHELFVGGEGLARGAKGVMTTLIHEAAHNVAHVRKIEDTSRQGRYHNKRFAALARELGLEPKLDKAIGWSPCSMPDATAAEYADALGRLDEALTIYRHSEMGNGAGKKSKNLAVAVCLCGTKIRLSRKAFESAPITCGACESPFVAVFDDED